MALYVKFMSEERPETVEEFIKKYYTKNVDPYTAFGHDTYNDENCNVFHCAKKYRSFDDLLELSQTYYPDTTEKDLMHLLLTVKIPLQGENSFAKPHLGICSEMNKIRYVPHNAYSYSHIDMRMLNSKFTWKELLVPLGINSLDDFKAYINKQQ